MKNQPFVAKNIDEYIAAWPEDVQEKLETIRQIVIDQAPGAIEAIKYAMPTFVLNGNLVYFAVFKTHIGFYPVPTNNPDFDEALRPYKTGKGSLQIPLNQPIPVDLITRVVQYRVAQNTAKGKS